MNWIALDIGGANLKLADGRGFAQSHVFAMWEDHRRLAWQLRSAIAEAPESDHLAVTMTGELADCFTSKTDGVKYILGAVHEAADGRHTRVYLVDGRLVSPLVAIDSPLLAASANWHALASYCGRFVRDKSALLIDLGSTTVDIVPLHDGKVVATASTDPDRLAAGELVYTGLERSPVCALVKTLPYRGRRCRVAQEVFATMRDVHLLLGNLPEEPGDHQTADGQPASCAAAHRRMARMLCADRHQVTLEDARKWAREIADAQLQMLASAVQNVLRRCRQRPATVVIAGHGDAVAGHLLERLGWSGEIVSLNQQLDAVASRCATAHALAVLAHESAGDIDDRK